MENNYFLKAPHNLPNANKLYRDVEIYFGKVCLSD